MKMLISKDIKIIYLMKYLITVLENLDYSDMWNTPVRTYIVDDHKKAMKIFINNLEHSMYNHSGFVCACNITHHFVSEIENPEYENNTVYIDFETLCNKYDEDEYICTKCEDDFCKKGKEIIDYINEIYNETIDKQISLTVSLQDICKVYIMCINDTITKDIDLSFNVLDDSDEIL